MECHKQYLSIAKEVGDRVGEGIAYYQIGCVYELSDSLHEALDNYKSSVKVINDLRSLLQSEDLWKISFRNTLQDAFTAWWRTLVRLQKIDEALCVAEQGRAQALNDLSKIQYDFELHPSVSSELRETLSDISSIVSTQAIFIGLDRNTINLWIVSKGNDVQFRQKEIEHQHAVTFLESLRKDAFKENHIGVRVKCENRTMDEIRDERDDSPINEESGLEIVESSPYREDHSLRRLYDYIIGPIAKLLEDDEVVIVPDGPLCLVPYAAFVDDSSRHLNESFRIRIVPSLTTLKLIAGCSKDYHGKSQTLLVGDPCLEEVKKKRGKPKLKQLPFAREEVEMIGKIVKVTPLTGKEATKDEVLKRISFVALVHIAAHGKMETGEIVLAPNPDRKSKVPQEKDYILKIADVQAVHLQAKLVVLSCCHSGRGKVTADGVIGIARAFLGAGARSVLVSLWAIDDEATMEFMRRFYKYLTDGNSASVSLNSAMKCVRESEKFSAVKYWAPFILIGDDVTLEF